MRLAALLGLVLAACSGGTAKSDGPSAPSPRGSRCAPQQCTSDDAGCDAIVLEGVWIWNGKACVEAYASGCGVQGPDCAHLYADRDSCVRARASCL